MPGGVAQRGVVDRRGQTSIGLRRGRPSSRYPAKGGAQSRSHERLRTLVLTGNGRLTSTRTGLWRQSSFARADNPKIPQFCLRRGPTVRVETRTSHGDLSYRVSRSDQLSG